MMVHSRRIPKGHAPRNENLSVVFRDPELFKGFQEHLKTEFSVENLLFCQAAQEFLEKSLGERACHTCNFLHVYVLPQLIVSGKICFVCHRNSLSVLSAV